MRFGVYVMVRCLSIRLSVPSTNICHSPQPGHGCRYQSTPAIAVCQLSIDSCRCPSCSCGCSHVESRGTRLNTDLLSTDYLRATGASLSSSKVFLLKFYAAVCSRHCWWCFCNCFAALQSVSWWCRMFLCLLSQFHSITARRSYFSQCQHATCLSFWWWVVLTNFVSIMSMVNYWYWSYLPKKTVNYFITHIKLFGICFHLITRFSF